MIRPIFLAILALTFIYTIDSVPAKDRSPSPNNSGKPCGQVKCPGNKIKKCAYGYQKKDGCEICKCNDPCNPPGKAKLCGPGQRCHVEKKPDGTFGSRCDAAAAPRARSRSGQRDKSPSKADCNLPQEVGHCRAAKPRFYYNSATKSCESFTYGGCGGNKNNFLTKGECEKACKA